ncbi:MAG: tRNA (N6-threonylcarbamoyladenosine(37)-N6)-methyltransferase TrmO, partial [Firmicutes bacterium]|nr:tRNA (N6-threonylcarbamoyladenosine(37)-N6)-methyltransferase TrmO [Bacillota bacterium]
DLMDGTPIYDIKPYLPYVDAHPEATGGFAQPLAEYALDVEFSEELLERIQPDRREGLVALLKQDPRPAYQKDPTRVYGFSFAGWEIKFTVDDECGVLTVHSVE